MIKEWIWSKSNPYLTPESVKAEQIGWGVPTIQRLWFGYVIILHCNHLYFTLTKNSYEIFILQHGHRRQTSSFTGILDLYEIRHTSYVKHLVCTATPFSYGMRTQVI